MTGWERREVNKKPLKHRSWGDLPVRPYPFAERDASGYRG
jgi:hypothetical protein